MVNKGDDRFIQAMEFDMELTYSLRDKNGDKFILRYYKSNDTIELYKISTHNDGILGGKIVKRAK